MAYVREHGIEVTGPALVIYYGQVSPREVYFARWDEVGDDDPACGVAFPFE